ncbi:unnamed protein product [Leptidea sinapis]|uniref:Uncharacterized protein n=1 Tax=Leptidea sinapis TaxID=189913 RepID=A0A5E4QRC1_9NEOP|nr:unnamed protein product [Leptidea sinapis]
MVTSAAPPADGIPTYWSLHSAEFISSRRRRQAADETGATGGRASSIKSAIQYVIVAMEYGVTSASHTPDAPRKQLQSLLPLL